MGTSKDLELTEKDLELYDKMMEETFPSYWTLKYRKLKKRPFTFMSDKSAFRHRPWQIEILDDKHKNKVVEKSRQLGLSELGITECIQFLATNPNTKAMYTFPRDQQMKDFSSTRIKPMESESEYLAGLFDKHMSNIALKKIGDSYLFMRSAWGTALGEGTDLDYVGFDEYDRMKDEVELAFMEGLSSSAHGYIRRWSTPTIPGRGINLAFQKSDQRRYTWTCEHCGERQYLTFEDNVIQINPDGVNKITQEIEPGTFMIGCKKCKKEINRWGMGEWVPSNPSVRDLRGYHITQMDAAWITADSIMKRQFDYTSKQLFMNYVVGEAYAAHGLMVTEDDIRQAIRVPEVSHVRNSNKHSMIAVGIDWGTLNWMYVLALTPQMTIDTVNIYVAEDNPSIPLEPVNRFAAILRNFQPEIIVADAGYGADRNSFLFSQFPQAFYACQWTTLKDAFVRAKWKNRWNEQAREVTVDKTVTMQRMMHRLKSKVIGMPPLDQNLQLFIQHLKNVRLMDVEEGGIEYQQVTRVGPDHLACALAYGLVGMDRLLKYGTAAKFEWDFM